MMLTINPKEVSTSVLHSYLIGTIAPRPIGLVSSSDMDGNVNLSPFSFFNVFGTNPPTLIFSPVRRLRDHSPKHTLENVLIHDEVVINMVDYDMVEQMSLSSCEYPKGVNEFVKAGFTAVKSDLITPPRIGESKAAFECKVKNIIQVSDEGGAPNLVICEIILAHFSEDILGSDGKIDQTKTDWVARLGGDWYCRASGPALFELPKLNVHNGIGVDAIPDYIKLNPSFTANELGRLGNVNILPSQEEVDAYHKIHPNTHVTNMAKILLSEGKLKEAWMILLYK